MREYKIDRKAHLIRRVIRVKRPVKCTGAQHTALVCLFVVIVLYRVNRV
eukprot:gene10985-7629_t